MFRVGSRATVFTTAAAPFGEEPGGLGCVRDERTD